MPSYSTAIRAIQKDLDVWIELSPDNANKILDALKKFGFGSLGLKPGDFLQSDQIIQLGYPPNRIDILTTLKDLKFEDCYNTKIGVEIQGLPIYFIDIENLKNSIGRSFVNDSVFIVFARSCHAAVHVMVFM